MLAKPWFVQSWKGLEFYSRLEKSLNSVKVLEKYLFLHKVLKSP